MASSPNQKASVIRNHGEDFYKRIGAMGGKKITPNTKNKGLANPSHPLYKGPKNV